VSNFSFVELSQLVMSSQAARCGGTRLPFNVVLWRVDELKGLTCGRKLPRLILLTDVNNVDVEDV
jgi:hypothetical protein